MQMHWALFKIEAIEIEVKIPYESLNSNHKRYFMGKCYLKLKYKGMKLFGM